MSTDLPRIATAQFPALPSSISPESRYWRKYKSPVIVREYGAVSHIHFSPVAPHDFAVTASTRVQVYSAKTRTVKKTKSRATDVVFSGEFRKDGKLIVNGGATGQVQIYQYDSRSILRSIDIHKLPTHVTKFSPHNLTTLLTASDDKTIRVWDITLDKPVSSFKGHTDYVRTAEFMDTSPSLFLSGSYDQTVRLWDARVAERGGEVQSYAHESVVERVLPIQGTTVVSAGGPDVRVWDLSSGSSRPLRIMQNHAKGVSSLAKTSSNSRLLSGGLDGHLKIYDTTEWKVLHSVKYPHPILSVGQAPDDKHLVVGMQNGLLSIRTRSTAAATSSSAAVQVKSGKRASKTVQRFLRGATYRPTNEDGMRMESAVTADEKQSRRLKKWDNCIRRYAYSDALDAVLKNGETMTTYSVLRELKQRSGLSQALSRRDDEGLAPILRYLVRHIKDVRLVALLIDVSMVILEIYGGALGNSPETRALIERLDEQVKAMLSRAKEAVKVDGMLQMLFAAASA